MLKLAAYILIASGILLIGVAIFFSFRLRIWRIFSDLKSATNAELVTKSEERELFYDVIAKEVREETKPKMKKARLIPAQDDTAYLVMKDDEAMSTALLPAEEHARSQGAAQTEFMAGIDIDFESKETELLNEEPQITGEL